MTAAGPTLDPSLRAASTALRQGAPLLALQQLGTREDAHAAAVRGIALAQLGEHGRAKALLTSAAKAFEAQGETTWAVKALAALAEIGFATRDLDVAEVALDAAPLRAAGDHESAAYVEIQKARLLALLGRTEEANLILAALASVTAPPAALARAEILATQGRYADAATTAEAIAKSTMNPLLSGEAARLARELRRPAFRFLCGPDERLISLVDLERITLPYVDTIRRRFGALDLRRRVAQLELLLALARGPVTSQSLFGRASESLQARLRVEVSRLRKETGLAVAATDAGFAAPPLGVLLPEATSLEALLADGEAWPPRVLAAVLGESVRTVERRLRDTPGLVAEGQARSRRWRLAQGRAGIATRLLLLTRTAPG